MSFTEYRSSLGRGTVAPLAGFPGIALTHTTVLQNLTDPSVQTETIAALQESAEFDVVFPMMDLTAEAEAFGAKVDWELDELPAVTGTLVETMEDAESLSVPVIGQWNRLDVFVKTCRNLKSRFPDKEVWAYALGPFSIAGRLMGMTEIAVSLKLEPETVHTVLKKCSSLLLAYTEALLDTGADGLMILEPASGMLGRADADEFSNAYIKKIVDQIHAKGKTAALHNCGNIDHLVESLCATGIDVLHIGSVSKPAEIYPRLPERVFLMGNLDPTNIFLRGTPEDVKRAAVNLLDRMADCERFGISTGCDLPPGVPMGNIMAFSDAIRPLASTCHTLI